MRNLRKTRSFIAITCALALAGCGGGDLVAGSSLAAGSSGTGAGTGTGSDGVFGPGTGAGMKPAKPANTKMDDAGLYQLQTQYLALNHHLQGKRPIFAAELPLYGMATYNGIAAFKEIKNASTTINGTTRNPDLVANMAMKVDFTRDKASGALWNFHDGNGALADGSVQLKGAHKTGEVTASGTGDLYWGSLREQITVNVDGPILEKGDGIEGYMTATTTTGSVKTPYVGLAILHYDSADHKVPY
ncbi:hypothetical protein [Pseudorhodobacter sp.]|uniref:hypothetical protein n=1 Tax=Pseudorhodobacter sp. TaxID=1934400 RepID=UPI00264967BE|nr:hypothetical protein [Pseudorhodobacter sp.]MDN5785626.1 hypothetical protein [Pseudorhodobacter sp.]